MSELLDMPVSLTNLCREILVDLRHLVHLGPLALPRVVSSEPIALDALNATLLLLVVGLGSLARR